MNRRTALSGRVDPKGTQATGRPAGRGAGSSSAAGPPRVRKVPRWLAPTALTLCAVGLLVSLYLTYDTFAGGTTLACPEGEFLNCETVTQSSWSRVLGIPVAPLGVLFFAVMTVLCLPRYFLRPGALFDRLRLAAVTVGLGMVFYLVWAELFQIRALCLWCTVVHLVTFVLFVVLLFGQALIEPPPARVRYKDRPR